MHLIQYEKILLSQMQNTGCERDAKIQQKVVKMLSIKYKIRKRGF